MPRAATTFDVFNAIAEPARRSLLDMINGREMAVEELVERSDMSQSSVSKHLKVLKEVGLVRVTQSGRKRYYAADAAGLQPVHAWAGQFSAFWRHGLESVRRRAEARHAQSQ